MHSHTHTHTLTCLAATSEIPALNEFTWQIFFSCQVTSMNFLCSSYFPKWEGKGIPDFFFYCEMIVIFTLLCYITGVFNPSTLFKLAIDPLEWQVLVVYDRTCRPRPFGRFNYFLKSTFPNELHQPYFNYRGVESWKRQFIEVYYRVSQN